jgi:hypothetical protein
VTRYLKEFNEGGLSAISIVRTYSPTSKLLPILNSYKENENCLGILNIDSSTLSDKTNWYEDDIMNNGIKYNEQMIKMLTNWSNVLYRLISYGE